jgi:GT2 family glycosyltransferase
MVVSKKALIVVIPNWNGENFLRPCLESLQRQNRAADRIIVVDNGSTDGSKTLVRQHFSDVLLIERERNYGFTGGVNPGIEEAIKQQVDYVVLFNNDAVAEKDWLKNLEAAAGEHPEAGIVTSKFLQMDDKRRIDATGDLYSIWGFPFPRGRDEVDSGQYDKPELGWVFAGSGGASLYRTVMLKEVGMFDQDFFAYYEDQDISFRAQLRGWRVWYEPTAVAYHRMGATSSRIEKTKPSASLDEAVGYKPNTFARYHSIKNFYFLYLKNMPGWLFWKYLPFFLSGLALIILNSLRRGQFNPLLRAAAQIIFKTPSMLGKRLIIQTSRMVETSYIDSLLYKAMPPTQKTLLKLRQRIFKR